MKTLHLHLTRQVLQTLVMTVLVFTFVLLLGNVLREVMAMLVSRQATPGGVARAIALLIPYVLVFALPMGLLTATLLVFGRFSADQELTAARAGGISLLALVAPVLALAAALSLLSAAVNCEVAPRCRVAYKALLDDLRNIPPTALIPENKFVTDFDGWVVYVARRRGEVLEDVLLFRLEKGEVVQRTRARRATITVNAAERELEFNTEDTSIFLRVQREQPSGPEAVWQPVHVGEMTVPMKFKPAVEQDAKPKLSEMTFTQLRAELREARARGLETSPILVQLHRMVSFSFACIGFTLVGIPLGIHAHRRETSAGVAMALLLVLVYYSFFILGQALEMRAAWQPHLLMWVPNFLFQCLGAWLLWRADRGA
ncbi:MAG: YjgP/YjgQ family permease [Verrucomicrobia bacterium]|nr:YjgP/YjgQ family permease [Verrucomicrobiota bacterium]